MSKLALLTLLLLACGPSAGAGGPDAMGTNDPCSGTESRCVGRSYQVCQNDFFVEEEECTGADLCDPGLGCVACRPNWPRTCVGDNVHECNPDGTVGGLIETCEFEQCSNGNCGTDDCAAGAELIYLVDESYRLWSFDPRLLPGDPFSLIGNLNCPAAVSLPGWDPLQGPSTPFSMSVDRTARAWVLYTSGQIFFVDTSNAACQASGFQVAQQGFELFGMGFVSDSPGSSAETLYISGGTANLMESGDLGRIDPATMQVTRIGSLPTAELSPELTGTGAAELYGYYPGVTTSKVGRISKTTALNEQTWSLPPASTTVQAWAFAHWGGKFYIFLTVSDILTTNSQVLLLDPASGITTTVLDNTQKVIVGAGVSTCAPVIVE